MAERRLLIATEAVSAIRAAIDKKSFEAALSGTLSELGFTSFHMSFHKKNKDEVIFEPTMSTRDKHFFEEYARQDWNSRNPRLDRATTCLGPIAWSVSEVGDDPRTRALNEFFDAMEMRSGLIVPLCIGSELSGICVESREDRQIPVTTIRTVELIANAAMIKAENLGLCPHAAMDNGERRLSIMQIEIIKWAAEGKSNTDIATILNITPRAVNYHMSEILRKLGVATRAQAVAVFFGGPRS